MGSGSQHEKDGSPLRLPPNLILRPSARGDGSQDEFFRLPRTGRKQYKYKGTSSVSRQESQCSPPYARSAATPQSIGSASVDSTIRRRDARDIFDEYGIARPENWLSEGSSENGTTKQNLPAPAAAVTLRYRICHSCRRYLPPGTECPECGHESCIKCTDEMPLDSSSLIDRADHPRPLVSRHRDAGSSRVSSNKQLGEKGDKGNLQGGSRVSHTKTMTPKPFSASIRTGNPPGSVTDKDDTILDQRAVGKRNVSDTLKANPFVQADNKQKALALTPQVQPQHAWTRRPTELSDCLPQRHMDRSVSDSTSPEDCENASCKGSSTGIRHSVRCTSRRKALRQLASRDWNADRYVHERARHNHHAPLQDPLQRKIDQLYHHSDDLHRSQHIIEHLAAGTRALLETVEDGKDSGPGTQPDPRFHCLAADKVEAVGHAMVDHDLSRDFVTQTDHQHRVPSFHSLHADELFQEAEAVSIHSLIDDLQIQREFSPMSLGTMEEVRPESSGAGTMPLHPVQDVNRFNTDNSMF